MGLLKKGKKKKPLRTTGRGAAGTKSSALRPQQLTKLAPCMDTCPSGNDIRGWLTVVAQREKLGIDLDAALDRAWQIEVDTNPFPAVMGRVCPHPCEEKCNRSAKDGAVSINGVERHIGDWGLGHDLALPKLDAGGPFEEKIAVVGAGPAGLSCAYQLARRGYSVTVFEALPESGGMLRYGIPEYRLPREVIDKEVERITDLGVEIRYGVAIGKDTTLDDLRRDYDAVFVAIGAHTGKTLGVPGEDGPNIYTGTDFLRQVATGNPPPVGEKVVVVGGGDTAVDAARVALRVIFQTGIDAARVARRMSDSGADGSDVMILYRRTREEMPAIDREVEEALEEQIRIEFLAAPAEVVRGDDGSIEKVRIQHMELGEPDASGRRRPVPIEGKITEIEADTVITAVSQAPDCKQLGAFTDVGWLNADEWGRTELEGVWSGGDNINLGLATAAIGQGRSAALSMHAALRGEDPATSSNGTSVGPERIKMDFYEASPRAEREVLEPEVRLAEPQREIDLGIGQTGFEAEVARCFSCGECFGCERCWMYCTPGCFKKVKPEDLRPGSFYTIDLGSCDGCNKCADECPCGFLDMK